MPRSARGAAYGTMKGACVSAGRAGSARLPQQPLHAVRHRDPALARERLVVLFDVVQFVQIVDHQPARLLDPARARVGEPVDALQARAVAEVEPRNRVERPRGLALAFLLL